MATRRTSTLRGSGARIEGLREFRKELTRAEPAFPRYLRAAYKGLAERIATRARLRAAGQANPRWPKQAVDSIVARADKERAQIAFGGNRRGPVQATLGLEFGAFGNIRGDSRKGHPGHTRMFPAWRGNKGNAGYAIWPTIRNSSQDIQETTYEAIDSALERAFPQ